MLILSRKHGESLIINGDIEVKILEIQGSHVKVGVSAPKDIVVDRKEIHQSKLIKKLGEHHAQK